MRRLILDVILHAGKPLALNEIAVQLVVRHGVDETISVDDLQSSIADMQRNRLIAQVSDRYAVTAIARKLMGKVACARKSKQ